MMGDGKLRNGPGMIPHPAMAAGAQPHLPNAAGPQAMLAQALARPVPSPMIRAGGGVGTTQPVMPGHYQAGIGA